MGEVVPCETPLVALSVDPFDEVRLATNRRFFRDSDFGMPLTTWGEVF
ncbi:hypothetical protein Pla111_31250 [Botrimarina hoheduenensis]|uniref:Uncharacterized protein n=1 Tax=Botrimarina hoheduenensis TaxID=2528000 RepID=A0A5C5VT04_9BACT|nr:hypothetical protein Pla111_31250 [Botrimarina hoheduenensis]